MNSTYSQVRVDISSVGVSTYLTDMAKFILHLLHHPLVICSAAMQCRANVNHSWSGMQH